MSEVGERGTNTGALWGGRFAGGPADALAALSKSTHFDWRLALLRHRRLQGACPRAAQGRPARRRRTGWHARRPWTGWTADVASGAYAAAETDEDVHGSLERGLIERAGAQLGGKLRAGRSRNDQIATLGRMYLRDHARIIAARRARRRRRPGGARPRRTTAWPCPAGPTCSMPSRCCSATTCWPTPGRCCATCSGCRTGTSAPAVSPYGSGALAGSSLGLDPNAVAADLGFDSAAWNSIDGTASRDVFAEFAWIIGDDRRGPVPDLARKSSCGPPRSSPSSPCTTPTPPAPRSCRRRRTRTWRSWRAARPAG